MVLLEGGQGVWVQVVEITGENSGQAAAANSKGRSITSAEPGAAEANEDGSALSLGWGQLVNEGGVAVYQRGRLRGYTGVASSGKAVDHGKGKHNGKPAIGSWF